MDYKEILISDINPAFYNPRISIHPNDKEYRDIKNSIERYGMVEPLIVNEVNNRLISGHQRLTVLKDMGCQKAPVVFIHEENETREKALCIALNKIKGTWDNLKLSDLLRTLKDDDSILEDLGFESKELCDLLGEITFDDVKDCKEEVTGDLSDVAVSVGQYGFKLERERYTEAVEQLKIEAEFDEGKICTILKNRLFNNDKTC